MIEDAAFRRYRQQWGQRPSRKRNSHRSMSLTVSRADRAGDSSRINCPYGSCRMTSTMSGILSLVVGWKRMRAFRPTGTRMKPRGR